MMRRKMRNRNKPIGRLTRVADTLPSPSALKETLDILADPAAMKGLRAGEANIRKKRHRSWRAIKRDLAK